MVIFYCVPKLIYSLGAASDVNQDYVAKGVSNQTCGQDVQDQMNTKSSDSSPGYRFIFDISNIYISCYKMK